MSGRHDGRVAVVPKLQAIKRVELPDDLTGQTLFVDGGLVRA